MNTRPKFTIALILTTIFITFVLPAFDTSLFGVQGHPTRTLSFMPESPLRAWGVTFLFSPFLHVGWEHLLVNFLFFIPMAMIIERQRSGGLLLFSFTIIHVQVLFYLFLLALFFPMEGKSFLGLSHIVAGLYTYWGLKQKKYFMLSLPVLMIIGGWWQEQASLTVLAHAVGIMTGAELFFLGHLREKMRLQGAD